MPTRTDTEHQPIGRGSWLSVGLGCLVMLLAIWQFFSAIDDRDFHRDEARWIHRAVYLREMLHPFSDYWEDATWRASGTSSDEIYRLRAQPPVGSYVIGIGMLLQGEPLPEIGYWNMDHDDAWNTTEGNKPTDAQLLAARRTTAAVGVLTVLLIYLIGLQLTNPYGAAMGAAFFALHPLARYLATFAGSDITLAFFIALSAWLAGRLAARPGWARAVLLGIAIGLGGGTKLSPLGIAVALAALGVVLAARKAHRRLGVMLMSTPLVAAITFVASYPYLWRDPITNSRNLYDYRTWGMEVQGEIWTQVAIASPWEALQHSWRRFGSEDWSIIGRFFSVAWSMETIVALIGAGVLIWLVSRRGLASATALIAAVLSSAVIITFAGMKVDWARYHLPILLAMAVCIGTAIGDAISLIQHWLITPRDVTT